MQDEKQEEYLRDLEEIAEQEHIKLPRSTMIELASLAAKLSRILKEVSE